jgi:hypothetical protein
VSPAAVETIVRAGAGGSRDCSLLDDSAGMIAALNVLARID